MRRDRALRQTDSPLGGAGPGKVDSPCKNIISALINSRLRNANILLITIRALANEIAKNLVLAGIGSLTIQDDQAVDEDDLGAQFLVAEGDVGKNAC